MSDPKAKVGDLVHVARYPAHPEHIGRVLEIERRPRDQDGCPNSKTIVYITDCSCGATLRLDSSHLEVYEMRKIAPPYEQWHCCEGEFCPGCRRHGWEEGYHAGVDYTLQKLQHFPLTKVGHSPPPTPPESPPGSTESTPGPLSGGKHQEGMIERSLSRF